MSRMFFPPSAHLFLSLYSVNAILPGFGLHCPFLLRSYLSRLFPSKMTAFGFKNVGHEAFASAQPTGRYGQLHDVAGLAMFLASPASSHITGVHILLDGGARFLHQKIAPVTKL